MPLLTPPPHLVTCLVTSGWSHVTVWPLAAMVMLSLAVAGGGHVGCVVVVVWRVPHEMVALGNELQEVITVIFQGCKKLHMPTCHLSTCVLAKTPYLWVWMPEI